MLHIIVRLVSSGSARWQAIVGFLFVLALAIDQFGLHVFAAIEHRGSDYFLRHHAAEFKPDPNIVVVDIDDQSMVEMQEMAGLWAWPREIHADLLDGLAEFSPRAIVFDMAFSESDRKHPKSDARLAESITALSPHVYLAATLTDARQGAATQLHDVQSAFGIKRGGTPNATAMLLLPHAVPHELWRLGLDNSILDDDGVLRRYRLLTSVQGWQLPSLPVRVATDLGLPLPPQNAFSINWPATGHTHYSYSVLYRLLTEQRPGMNEQDVQSLDKLIRGKIIVIGSSATSTFDHHLTPFGASYPGVDVLAISIDNLVNQRYLRNASRIGPFLFGTVLILGLLFAFSRQFNPVYVGIVLLVVSLLGLFVADYEITRQYLLPLISPLIFAWGWYLAAAIAGYLREQRSRKQTVNLLGRFLNPEVVHKIADQGETVESLSGHMNEISVLFSDIRGFTTLSETHEPQEVVALLNRYFDRQVEVIFKHGGTLDKFIGDCIMAFWGAPLDDPNHARHAVAAALEMEETLLRFKEELAAEGSEMADIDVGIGVHSGPAVVGFIGAKRKLDYTAIGDTVNLASRIEGLTKGLARVLVSKETMLACNQLQNVEFSLRGAFHVKGRAAEVELYEPRRNIG